MLKIFYCFDLKVDVFFKDHILDPQTQRHINLLKVVFSDSLAKRLFFILE